MKRSGCNVSVGLPDNSHILSSSRELCFPCSRIHDLLLGRHVFFRSESLNPKPLMGMRSCLTSKSHPVISRRLFQSDCPLPSLVTGRGQVLWPSKHPTSVQTQPRLDSSRSLRRIRLLLRRRARRYWPCVRIFTNAVMPRLMSLL